MKKICKKCNIEKDILLFNKKKNSKDGLNYSCKECCKNYSQSHYLNNVEKYKIYYIENKENIKEVNKNYKLKNKEYYRKYLENYYIENKECLSEYKRSYYIENKQDILNYKKEYYNYNREYYLKNSSNWRLNNSSRYNEYLTNWRLNNPEYSKEWRLNNPDKIKKYYNTLRLNKPYIIAWRTVLQNTIKRIGTKKENSTLEILGYSADDLKKHIESLFLVGMSWNNWGYWHIDHKYPVSKFNKETPMSIVNSLYNLQPLWASDNLSKGNKIKDFVK
jgi:hypothetical protein